MAREGPSQYFLLFRTTLLQWEAVREFLTESGSDQRFHRGIHHARHEVGEREQ